MKSWEPLRKNQPFTLSPSPGENVAGKVCAEAALFSAVP